MKKWLSYSIIALLVIVLAACGAGSQSNSDKKTKQDTEQTSQAAFPVKVKDARDKEITLKKQPKKIVSLMPSNTEIVYALGLEKELVGVTSNDDYPKSVKKKAQVGDMNVNAEKVIALNPDLVLAHASSMGVSDEVFKQIESAGIPVFVVKDSTTFDTVYDSITQIGKLTGKTKEANQTIKDMKEKVASIEKKAKTISKEDRKKVWIEVSGAPEIYTTGKGTFMNEMLTMIGADNVAASEKGWVKFSEEQVVKLNPDVIIATYDADKNEIMKRPAWSSMTAVKEGNIEKVNQNKINRLGPRIVDGLEDLAKAVYPEVYNK
ncbi:ABC transporter substrate-binding protein [Priestia megaterium]|uniref:ABC transporter substrate-binding protein n=2 Tax=Priestia megaterium TaxID=1404 RepID=A0AAX6BID4_PRIMG|nr:MULTISPECIES: ABC transporter substrate-binding protein [Priestia]MED3816477.1 ABC transporter substrate-binding protein [Priestia aryabhattai]QFY72784.1 ABC transporter substrate-binding protein [Priestia megaterium]QSF33837.1 ABC transporter substrate-binding protein [Priestia megaterium]GMG73469.1 ABC transporter substrate-binding protein [Priestia megaterium]